MSSESDDDDDDGAFFFNLMFLLNEDDLRKEYNDSKRGTDDDFEQHMESRLWMTLETFKNVKKRTIQI